MRRNYFRLLVPLYLLIGTGAGAQDSLPLDIHILSALDRKAAAAASRWEAAAEKRLQKLTRTETSLRRWLRGKDTALANTLWAKDASLYEGFKTAAAPAAACSKVYSPQLDSLQTALRFLQGKGRLRPHEVSALLSRYDRLQQQLNGSEKIRQQLEARARTIRKVLEGFGAFRKGRRLRKEMERYKAELQEYKRLFERPSVGEQRLLSLAASSSGFRAFFARHSDLAALFSLPGETDEALVLPAGLQSRIGMDSLFRERFGNTTVRGRITDGAAAASGPAGSGEGIPNRLFSTGGGEAAFEEEKSATQYKTLRQRLEWGVQAQPGKMVHAFPQSASLGVTLRYRINDRSIAGLGLSSGLALGLGWSDVRVAPQFLGLRSYIDWRMKGSFYLSGGYERNVRLHPLPAAAAGFASGPSSGLLGVGKKFAGRGKFRGTVQLLWDFCSLQKRFQGQSLLFRTGYQFK